MAFAGPQWVVAPRSAQATPFLAQAPVAEQALAGVPAPGQALT
jgi:hypothetical protein